MSNTTLPEPLQCLIISASTIGVGGILSGAVEACQDMARYDGERTAAVLRRCLTRGVSSFDIYDTWANQNDRFALTTLRSLEARTR